MQQPDTWTLNVIDDKILNAEEFNFRIHKELMNNWLKALGELDFLRTLDQEMFTTEDYSPEYTKISELSAEFELTRAENESLKKRNSQMMESMQQIITADTQIVDMVSKLAAGKHRRTAW